MVTTEARRRYRVLGTIGKGGFGTVYKAELMGESGFSKVVALKVLNPDVSEVTEIAERLRDEARVLGLVHHRAIVQVDGLIQIEGRWTIVMEYVHGIDLKHLMRQGPLSPGPALEIITEVASALRAAREQPGPDGKPLSLLHRDIKPSNLQITSAGEVKVLDFGTARANFESREAKTQQLAFGTLDYMAPERMEFIDVSAGDVYSLGAVLFEMITGTPLGRTSPRPTKHQALRQQATAHLTEVGAHEGIIALIRDMIAFEPDDRPDLREVESRGRDLRVACGGPWLSDFAADVVPKLLAARTSVDEDDMAGEILTEGSTAHLRVPGPEPVTAWVRAQQAQEARAAEQAQEVPEPVPSFTPPRQVATVLPQDVIVGRPPPARRPWLWGGLAAGLLGLLVLAAGSLALVLALPDRSAPVAVTEEPAPVEVAPEAAEPEVVPEEVAAPEPEPEPAPPVAAPTPRPTPRPTAPPPVARGRVVVSGDATEVRLVAGGRSLSPGSVPAGLYTIEATFQGRGTVNAGMVTVPEGGTVTIDCQRAFARCTAR